MPKVVIDYSNTVIYKIICLDENVKDLYVGHTTNFIQRKYYHKQSCINEKLPSYKFEVHQFIREHGNWNNWIMEIICVCICSDQTDSKKKEKEYAECLNAKLQLNNIYKQSTISKVASSLEIKEIKEINITNTHNISHLKNTKHNNSESKTTNINNSVPIFCCKQCNTSFNSKTTMWRHQKICIQPNNTIIHSNVVPCQPKCGLDIDIVSYDCECGKKYTHKNNFYRHKKKCDYIIKDSTTNNITNIHNIPLDVSNINNQSNISNDIVLKLIKQNNDLQQMLIEQNNKIFELAKETKETKNVTKNVTNNNNTTNNHFNLNVFLNEKCKDALNLVDFLDSLKLKINDLEETARLGYSQGISRIFVNGLKELDVFKRPIHCSDLKREILYIKDQNSWEKEDTQKSKLSRAIKVIGHKNMKQIFEWQKLYPEYNDPESKQNDKYNKIIYNTMNGSTQQEQEDNLNKIIKNVTKEVVIDKNI